MDKKKLVQINVVCNGSTGRIMNQIQEKAISEGWEAYSFYGRGKSSNKYSYKIGNKFDVLFHVLITRLFDLHGHGSKFATRKLIKKIKEIDPDVIQLHNIHGYYLNLEILFNYLRNCNKKIVWTLHDCWAFTGHCTYFTMEKCERWRAGCEKCKQKKQYPKSILFDNSKKEYQIKKKLFTDINNLTIITPSEWLKKLVKQSFLKNYAVNIINNGIDLKIFRPSSQEEIDNMRLKFKIPKSNKIILGVASIWERRKGLDIFLELSKMIKKNTTIILIGLSKKQITKLPDNIIGMEKTEDLKELINLYTMADIFLNPSKEETFSLVTIEAMACGTKAIVSGTSAIKELINGTMCGIVINKEKTEEYFKAISAIEKKKNDNNNELLEIIKKYDKEDIYMKYIKLYEVQYEYFMDN